MTNGAKESTHVVSNAHQPHDVTCEWANVAVETKKFVLETKIATLGLKMEKRSLKYIYD